jgi:predicted nucleic acid-binding protein
VRRVFVDTSAFFAHLAVEDVHHAEARVLFERADRESWTLIATNAVVWETYTLIRVRARNGMPRCARAMSDAWLLAAPAAAVSTALLAQVLPEAHPPVPAQPPVLAQAPVLA